MTTNIRQTMAQEVGEGGNAVLTCYFEDGATPPVYIPVAGISSVKFWLDNLADGATINSKSDVEVKNANGGTLAEVTEAGVTRTKLTLLLAPADNPIVDSTRLAEWHLGTLKGFYNGGAGMVPKEFIVKVVAMNRQPFP